MDNSVSLAFPSLYQLNLAGCQDEEILIETQEMAEKYEKNTHHKIRIGDVVRVRRPIPPYESGQAGNQNGQ